MAASMVFFESERSDLDSAIRALEGRGLSVDRDGDRVAVTWPGVPDRRRCRTRCAVTSLMTGTGS